MKVVEKIEGTFLYGVNGMEIAWRISIIGKFCQIDYKTSNQYDWIRMFGVEANDKHQATLKAVVAFVSWYNNGGQRAWA